MTTAAGVAVALTILVHRRAAVTGAGWAAANTPASGAAARQRSRAGPATERTAGPDPHIRTPATAPPSRTSATAPSATRVRHTPAIEMGSVRVAPGVRPPMSAPQTN